MAPAEIVRHHRSTDGGTTNESQPHLRWQVLVIFTIFVTTIRFYVLGNKSEVLIYCVCGLILLMAALLLSLCSLRKGLSASSSPRLHASNYHQRSGSGSSSMGSRRRSRPVHINHPNVHHQQHHYPMETVINPGDEFGQNDQLLAESVMMGGYSVSDFIGYGVEMNPINSNNVGVHQFQHYTTMDAHQLHQQQHQLLTLAAAAAPPPYHIAIQLPDSSTRNKENTAEYDENAPPPPYDKITQT